MDSYITVEALVQIGIFLCAFATLLLALSDTFGKKK